MQLEFDRESNVSSWHLGAFIRDQIYLDLPQFLENPSQRDFYGKFAIVGHFECEQRGRILFLCSTRLEMAYHKERDDIDTTEDLWCFLSREGCVYYSLRENEFSLFYSKYSERNIPDFHQNLRVERARFNAFFEQLTANQDIFHQKYPGGKPDTQPVRKTLFGWSSNAYQPDRLS